MAIVFKPYFIECITNLHAGSGDTNYGIVDKLVQRDVVSGLPTIHASSLKGALRAHFEDKWKKEDPRISAIFGKDGNDTQSGDFKFLDADLLALPVRCTYQNSVLGLNNHQAEAINHKSNLLCSKELFNQLLLTDTLFADASAPTGVYAEDVLLSKATFVAPFKEIDFPALSKKYATFSDAHYATITKNLPVIARNKVSENLWYEEIVPHKTIFITYIGTAESHAKAFEAVLNTDLIQIGANASVGFGLCKFHPITFK